MMGTKFRLQLVIVNESGHEQVQEVARIEREGVEMETLGLTLAEGKLILKKIQEGVVQEQIWLGDAIARTAVKRATARAITTLPCARCLETSSCRARGWNTAGASRMRKRPSAHCRPFCRSTRVRKCYIWK